MTSSTTASAWLASVSVTRRAACRTALSTQVAHQPVQRRGVAQHRGRRDPGGVDGDLGRRPGPGRLLQDDLVEVEQARGRRAASRPRRRPAPSRSCTSSSMSALLASSCRARSRRRRRSGRPARPPAGCAAPVSGLCRSWEASATKARCRRADVLAAARACRSSWRRAGRPRRRPRASRHPPVEVAAVDGGDRRGDPSIRRQGPAHHQPGHGGEQREQRSGTPTSRLRRSVRVASPTDSRLRPTTTVTSPSGRRPLAGPDPVALGLGVVGRRPRCLLERGLGVRATSRTARPPWRRSARRRPPRRRRRRPGPPTRR